MLKLLFSRTNLFFIIIILMAASIALAGEWAVFTKSVAGPVEKNSGIDPRTFRPRQFSSPDVSESYSHECHFNDGSMIFINMNSYSKGASVFVMLSRPGEKMVYESFRAGPKELIVAEKGFDLQLGQNRFRLEGNKYYIDLDLPETKGRFTFEILGPSVTFGDGLVKLPDGKSFYQFSQPISWARVKTELTRAGKTSLLQGWGCMEHDYRQVPRLKFQSGWRSFWLFGEDHALVILDFVQPDDAGEMLVQRLMFVDQDGRVFTSTRYPLRYDDWSKMEEANFKYPRHYSLTTEAQGAELKLDLRMGQVIMNEDLYSHLPSVMRTLARQLISNIWDYDFWSDYEITYTQGDKTVNYKGRGVGRWMGMEQE